MRCHRACSSRPPGPPPVSARYGRTRARGPGRDDPRGGHSQGPPPDLRTRQRPPLAPIARPAPAYRRRCVPVPGARPAGHAHQSGDVRPIIGGLAERQPWRGAGCFPRVRSWRRTGRPAIGRGRMRPVRPIDHAGGFIRPGPVTGIVCGGSGAGLAGQEAGACPFRPVVARSRADGRSFAGHGSASRPVCRPGWSSAERRARVGSGGVYAVSRSVAVRQACSTARSRAATRVSRAAMAWRLRRP